MNIDEIKQRLNAYFLDDKVEVFDSRGTGDHFSIIVISDKFTNVSRSSNFLTGGGSYGTRVGFEYSSFE